MDTKAFFYHHFYWRYLTTCELLFLISSEKYFASWISFFFNFRGLDFDFVLNDKLNRTNLLILIYFQRSDDQQGQSTEFAKRLELDQCIAKGGKKCCYTWVDFNYSVLIKLKIVPFTSIRQDVVFHFLERKTFLFAFSENFSKVFSLHNFEAKKNCLLKFSLLAWTKDGDMVCKDDILALYCPSRVGGVWLVECMLANLCNSKHQKVLGFCKLQRVDTDRKDVPHTDTIHSMATVRVFPSVEFHCVCVLWSDKRIRCSRSKVTGIVLGHALSKVHKGRKVLS